jgi:hypothetical protein
VLIEQGDVGTPGLGEDAQSGADLHGCLPRLPDG